MSSHSVQPSRPNGGQPTGWGRRHQQALFTLAGLTLIPGNLAAHAAPTPEPDQAIRASYLCRGRFDAVELTALFFNHDPSEVILLAGETATRLPQQLSASGSRYADGAQEFWIKGSAASWRLGANPAAAMTCRTQPAHSQR